MTQNNTSKIGSPILKLLFFISLFCFLLTGSYQYSVNKTTAFSLLIVFLITLFTCKINLKYFQTLSYNAICVLIYILVYTISIFYASTGSFASNIYSIYLAGFSVFFIASILVYQNKHNIKKLLSIIAICTAIVGIISIDAASIHLLSRIVESIYKVLFSFGDIFIGKFEEGTRMTSIIGSPNVFGGLTALGTFISAYLYLTYKSKTDKWISIICLSCNAVSLLYCFSLGSLAVMFFSIIVYFIFSGKEYRLKCVTLTITTVLTAFISVLIGFNGMGKQSALGFLPIISLIVTTVLLYFTLEKLDFIVKKLSVISGKKFIIFFLVIFIILSGAVITALSLTKPFVFDNSSLRRSIALTEGTYQLQIEFQDKPESISSVVIESQTYDQATTHTSTILYNTKNITLESSSLPIEFTVPYDSNICYINIAAPKGVTVNRLTVTDVNNTITKTIKTDYKLLPTFMVNRLQGLLVNQNAAQRFVFFKDGLKIFLESPVWGHGPGAFESNILEVQDYYYETNSAHNHYIQTLDEVGILGFIPFIGILLFSLYTLFKNRKDTQKQLFTATLFACTIMIIIHAFIEFTFTFCIYIIFAFLLFGIISSAYPKNQKEKKSSTAKVTKYSCVIISVLALVLYSAQFFSVQAVKSAAKSGDVYKLMDRLDIAAIFDFTNRNSHAASYLTNYQLGMDEEHTKKAQKYADLLEKHNSFSSLKTLYTFYFSVGEYEEAFKIINRRMELIKYNPSAWNETFSIYDSMLKQTVSQLPDPTATEFLPIVCQYTLQAYEQLTQYNQITPVPVVLNETNKQVISLVESISSSNYSTEDLKQLVLN